MGLTYGIFSVRDLLVKLEGDAALLRDEVTKSRLFNFVVTGYSMIDWIKNDPAVPQSAKCQSEISGLYQNEWLKICGDLAIASKHFSLTSRQPVVYTSKVEQGYGIGRFGKGSFGIGEESITIQLNDGSKYNVLDLVKGVENKWHHFFKKHGI